MKIRILITTLLLSLALPGAADFRTVVEGYEVALESVRLPQSESGTIAYKKCGDCPYETKRLAADAEWVINGETTTLEKFRQRMSELDDRATRIITVGHHLEKNVIVRVTTWIY